MFNALEELTELSPEMQKRCDAITLTSVHKAVSRKILAFEVMCNDPGPHLKMVNTSIAQNKFAGVELHAGQKSDVPICPAQFFRSLVNNIINRMLTDQMSHVSSVRNTSTSAGSEYDEIVTWSKVLDPETWPEFPAPCGENATSSLLGESLVQSMSIRLNVDSRQSIRAFRKFKENGGKRIPPDLIPLLLALKTFPLCTAACERGFSQMNLIVSPTRNSMLVNTVSCLLFGKLVDPPLASRDVPIREF